MIVAYIVSPNYDYLAASIIEGLKDLGHTVYTSEKSNYGNYLPRLAFCKKANSCDLLIIGSGKFTDYSYLKTISHSKSIYIDGSDYPNLEPYPSFPINMIFKRELLKSDIQASSLQIFPLPFAAENRYFEKSNLTRTIPVSFICSMSNYMRRSVKQVLLSNFENACVGSTGERAYNGVSGTAVNTNKYSNILNRSIVSVNVAGKGWDCARYWEIIAHKACLVTQRLDINIPNSFVEGQHYLAFSDMDELKDNISIVLNNKTLAHQLTNEAFEHLCLFHTSKKRAEYLLNTIDKHYTSGKVISFEGSTNLKTRFYYSSNWSLFKTLKALEPILPIATLLKRSE